MNLGKKILSGYISLCLGIRGALSIALVGSLPESNLKKIVATISFGVVLSSLIPQHIGFAKYVKKVFPIEKDDDDDDIISSHPK
jgi:NhaP-type Na+/H+ or K+/H+ antiporter